MQILSLVLPSSWKMVWRCLSNHRASCLFLLLPVSHKPKNETKSSPWHSIMMALMEEHGRHHCSGLANLPAPPRCLCEGSCQRSSSTAAASDPVTLHGRAFTLSVVGWGRSGCVFSDQSLASDVSGLPSSDFGPFILWKRPVMEGLWFMDGLSHRICDNTHCMGYGPTGDIVQGSRWCCNTLRLPCSVPVEPR